MKPCQLFSFLLLIFFMACQNTSTIRPATLAIKSDSAFAKIVFDTVIAYEYSGDPATPLIDSNGDVSKKVIQQKVLSPAQIHQLNAILSDSSNYGGESAACWLPHLGVIFYNKSVKVQNMSICLLCNDITGSFKIPLDKPLIGFSKKGIKTLYLFCKELGFNKYLPDIKKQNNL